MNVGIQLKLQEAEVKQTCRAAEKEQNQNQRK